MEFDSGELDLWLMRSNSSNSTSVVPVVTEGANYLICGPLLTIFIIIGVLDNIACVYVFLRPRPSAGRRSARLVQPIYVYLLTLALWDLVLLVTSFLLYNLHVIADAPGTNAPIITHPVYLHSLPYVYYATITAHTCANWVVVALGLERYFALCHPFRHRLLDGRRRAIYTVCFISLGGILYSLPRLYETKVSTEEEDEGNPISFNDFQQTVLYKTLYKVVGGMFLYSVGPFVCLFVVSIRVYAAVRQQRLFQAEKTRRSERRNGVAGACQKQQMRPARNEPGDCSYSINVMLIAVMVKLLFVHALPTALDVAETTMAESDFSKNELINQSIDISILLVVVNSGCNFFVYYICSRQFREEIRNLLRRCCCSCWRCWKEQRRRAGSDCGSDQTLDTRSRKDYVLIGHKTSTSYELCRKMSSYSDILRKISVQNAENM